MIADFIIGTAVILAVGYLGSWLFSPALRQRIEAPKYRFLQQLQEHDTVTRHASTTGEDSHV